VNDPTPPMTSNRPYLIRAVYEWIADNDMTPHLLVDAQYAGMRVPMQAVKDGRVVLNIAARAVNQLELGNEEIRFLARFGGVSHRPPARRPHCQSRHRASHRRPRKCRPH